MHKRTVILGALALFFVAEKQVTAQTESEGWLDWATQAYERSLLSIERGISGYKDVIEDASRAGADIAAIKRNMACKAWILEEINRPLYPDPSRKDAPENVRSGHIGNRSYLRHR